jgi:hypothetical protein
MLALMLALAPALALALALVLMPALLLALAALLPRGESLNNNPQLTKIRPCSD